MDLDNPNFISVEGVVYNKQKTVLIAYPPGRSGEFIIPSSVTSIGSSAFDGCRVSSITIPFSVTTIGRYVFGSRLKSIYVCAETPIALRNADNAFLGVNRSFTLYIPKGSESLYKAAEVWKKIPNIKEFDVTSVK